MVSWMAHCRKGADYLVRLAAIHTPFCIALALVVMSGF